MKELIIILSFIFFASITSQAQFIDSKARLAQPQSSTLTIDFGENDQDNTRLYTVQIQEADQTIVTVFTTTTPEADLRNLPLPQGQYLITVFWNDSLIANGQMSR